jgi:hypothetical protein
MQIGNSTKYEGKYLLGYCALMMETASASKTSVIFTRLHGATLQDTVNFLLDAVRTLKLTLH